MVGAAAMSLVTASRGRLPGHVSTSLWAGRYFWSAATRRSGPWIAGHWPAPLPMSKQRGGSVVNCGSTVSGDCTVISGDDGQAAMSEAADIAGEF